MGSARLAQIVVHAQPRGLAARPKLDRFGAIDDIHASASGVL